MYILAVSNWPNHSGCSAGAPPENHRTSTRCPDLSPDIPWLWILRIIGRQEVIEARHLLQNAPTGIFQGASRNLRLSPKSGKFLCNACYQLAHPLDTAQSPTLHSSSSDTS